MHAVGGSNHMPARYSNHRRAESTRRRAWLRGCLHSAQRDGKNCREAITASEPVWRAPPTFTDAILGTSPRRDGARLRGDKSYRRETTSVVTGHPSLTFRLLSVPCGGFVRSGRSSG